MFSVVCRICGRRDGQKSACSEVSTLSGYSIAHAGFVGTKDVGLRAIMSGFGRSLPFAGARIATGKRAPAERQQTTHCGRKRLARTVTIMLHLIRRMGFPLPPTLTGRKRLARTECQNSLHLFRQMLVLEPPLAAQAATCYLYYALGGRFPIPGPG